MKFSTKLYSGLATIFILVSILIIILISLLKQQNEHMSVLVDDITERMDAAYNIKNEINSLSGALTNLSTQTSKIVSDQIMREIEDSRVNINSSYQILLQNDHREEVKDLLTEFSTLYDTYEEKSQQLYETTDRKMSTIFWVTESDQKDRLLRIATSLYELQQQQMEDDISQTRKTYDFVLRVMYVYIGIVGIISIIVAIYLIRSLTKNLSKVVTVMSGASYKKGIKFPRLDIETKDEMGEIANAFNEMVSALESYSQKEIETRAKTEEQAWLDSKLAEVSGYFSLVESMEALAEFFTTIITPLVGAHCSIFYIMNKEEGNVYLEEVASYAIDPNYKKRISLGQGLVGQAAKENKPLNIKDIPKGYMKINSGMGEAEPKQIIIQPVTYEGKVLAIVEIASLHYFRAAEEKLLSKVIQNIGSSLFSLRNRMEVKRLLEDEQRLTEELQSQSEELQAQQQELMAINEELQLQYKVSEQKNTELERIGKMLEEKAEQLQNSSQYKSEFLANMSHELRTPLNSMLILSQVLVEKENEHLTPKQIEYLKTIYYSGNDLLRLINEILDLEKIETGKMEIVQTEVKVEHIQNSLHHQFIPVANQKDLGFFITIDKEVPEVIHTDEYRLNQVLKNLLSNAFKFTDKGRVILSIGISEEKAGNKSIVFTVKDTGIGIPQDKIEIVFEPFQQADGTISRKYGGTGLGLSICREITHLLGGDLQLTSTEGIGSSFVLTLPLNEPNTTSAEEKQWLPGNQESAVTLDNLDKSDVDHRVSLAGKKILIVDDDIRNIFSLSAALEEYNIKVLFSENGKDGIIILEENPDIDLILMDIMMPEMDGLETITHIREKQAFIDLPIIALTAKAMRHNREQCIEAGASDYISKPVNLEQLFSLIQVWLFEE